MLVAEDNADDIFLLTRLLKKAEIANPLHVAVDGQEVIDLLDAADGRNGLSAPELVFLDIKMPNRDGFEVLSWIRGKRALDALPVVMLTSSGEPRDVARARELNAQGFFVKYPPVTTLAEVLVAARDFSGRSDGDGVFRVAGNLLY